MSDYIIKKGDNLTKIAKEYGTTVKELQKLNNIKNANKIIAGETLKLPEGIGTTVEHAEAKPQDDALKKAREEAHRKEVEHINQLKKAQKNNTTEVSITKKTPKNDVAKSEYKTEELINKEIEKRHLKNVDIPYWASKIDKVSSEYNIPASILTSIISIEATFRPNSIGRYKDRKTGKTIIIGRGAMGQTSIAIKDFFSDSGGRYSLYKELDSKLVDDILFKKDTKGNILKNENGKPVYKYPSYMDLTKQCAKDDELSIKIGALTLKFNFVDAVSKKTGKPIKTVIRELKSGELQLSDKLNAECLAIALSKYNSADKVIGGISKRYKNDVMDSLRAHHYDFAYKIIPPTIKKA